ncbi:glycoside hydrolase family 97 protein [Dyella sp.]|uniref:glycoside hydrolase family 97 protein n=1 Tax=Dyella sp. TaxID=1869338 RepID=UPI002ED30379
MRPAFAWCARRAPFVLLLPVLASCASDGSKHAATLDRAQLTTQWRTDTPAATLRMDTAHGTATLVIQQGGQHVLDEPLGIRSTSFDYTHDLRLLAAKSQDISDSYRMTTGKRLDRQVNMHETRYTLENAAHKRLIVAVRAAADGVAYHYELPDETGNAVVTGETSAAILPTDAPAWLLPYNPWYEKLRVQTTARDAASGDYGYPSLFRVGDIYALLSEADVDGNYAGSFLHHEVGSLVYELRLADGQVHSNGITPWRATIVGSLATITESTLVDDLAKPARLTDTRWIRPGKVAWSWLSDRDSPGNLKKQKAFVDFASRHGLPYVLVDEGWKSDWVPNLVTYAQKRHVDILLWFKWQDLDTDAKRTAVLDQVKQWGVKGVKVDFMNSDSQERYRWYDAILEATSQRQLMIDLHGSTIPHGLARTWPHIMSMEAVRGTENDAPPFANTIQPFTRNVVGSMDFTPVALEDGPKLASIAHEVALPVVYESGWLSLADSPAAYERHPRALAFIAKVPTVWEETRLLAGDPGREAIIARHSGDRWYIGGVSAGPARTLTFSLDRLGSGPWVVDMLRDAPGKGRHDVVRKIARAEAGKEISVEVKENGGFVAVLCPMKGKNLGCY